MSITGTGMSSTDPCNIAGVNPNKAACAATGKLQDSNMCNIMNPDASLSACSAQAKQSMSASVSITATIGKYIGYALLIILAIAGIVLAIGWFTKPAEVVGGAKLAHFSRLFKKLMPSRR